MLIRTTGPMRVLLLWLLLLTGSELVRAQTGWNFVVFGDCLAVDGSDVSTNMVRELAAAVVSEHPDFVLFTGDFAFSGSAPGMQLWTNAMAAVYGAGILVYPTVGNHDFADPLAFSNIVAGAVPENGPAGEIKTTYSFVHSNALFLVLNDFIATNAYRVNQPWIDSILATNTLPHVFALGHVPAFRLYHQDTMDLYVTNRDIFWNSLSNAHARVYFCGHDHFYDHSRLNDGDGDPQNDIHQVIVGTGGALLHPDVGYPGLNSLWSPERVYHEAQYGYLSVSVAGENVTASWHHRTAPDTFPVAETFNYSLRTRPVLHYAFVTNDLTLRWSGTANLEASPRPSGPFTNVPGATSPYLIGQPAGSSLFYRLSEQVPAF